MKLYPVAPLHDGEMHINLPTITLYQSDSHQNIPAPVKHRKFNHRRVEDIIRMILLDSARFYNPNRRQHRREHTSTGTKLIYCPPGGPKQRKRMHSFLWDSDWRHGPESPDAALSAFELSFRLPVPSSSEEEMTQNCEHSNNFRLPFTSDMQTLVSPFDCTQSPSVLPTDHDHQRHRHLIGSSSSSSDSSSAIPLTHEVRPQYISLLKYYISSLLQFMIHHVLDMITFQSASQNHFIFLYRNGLSIVVSAFVDFKVLHEQ